MDFLPFSKLTQQNISPRIRNVLESAYQLTWRELEPGLKRTLDEFEGELFRKAEKAPTTDQQNRCFEALKTVRKSNSLVLIAMRDDFQRGMLAPLVREQVNVLSAAVAMDAKLSLVDNSTLELDLAISELCAKAEIKSSQMLHTTAVRFAVVCGGAPLSIEAIPVGPHRIVLALAKALEGVELSVALKVELLRTFDKIVLTRIPQLLEALNRQFCEQRVFAHLNLGMGRRAQDTQKAAEPVKVPEIKADAEPTGVARPIPESTPVAAQEPRTPSAFGPAHDPFGFSAVGEAMSVRQRDQAPPSRREAVVSPGPQARLLEQPANDASTTEPSQDLELFTTLRELLSGKRQGSGASLGSNTDPTAPQASQDDVQSVLTVLQAQPVSPVMVGGRWKSRRISDIKQDMLEQLRQLHGGRLPRLEQETTDTVDLVGLLFDHVLSDSKPSSTTHSLLTKLQVPVLKVAIKDKSFFSRRNHPARQFLNTIAENGVFWSEGDELDDGLVERMQLAVDRITAEYDNDIGVFETMLGDLGRHVSTLQRKAEVSEKRNVEAARGREKMELARKNASQSIEGFTKGRMLPPLVTHLLEGAWADVLALTQLRQDTDSPEYQERLETAGELAACFDLDKPVTKDDFAQLRPVLEEGMSLVGFHGPEIERTLNAVSELVVEGEALVPVLEPAEEREVTELVRSKARLGQEQEEPKSAEGAAQLAKQSILAHLRKDEKMQLNPKEAQMLERLKQMPFGTWFEFVINQQGDISRRKLSWFSPVTGRCLFLNSRGIKVAEKSLDELARDLIRGNAKLWEPAKETAIDRAWRSIKEKLKQWANSDRSLEEMMLAER